MTTPGHSLIAATTAILTVHSPLWVKIIVIIALILSHPLVDAIPHYHLYNFSRLPKRWPLALIELGTGLILIPLVVWMITGINPLWLGACVLASSAFDFMVAARIKPIHDLNHWFHWWASNKTHNKFRWEIAQITVLVVILVLVIIK